MIKNIWIIALSFWIIVLFLALYQFYTFRKKRSKPKPVESYVDSKRETKEQITPITISKKIYDYYSPIEISDFIHNNYQNYIKAIPIEEVDAALIGFIYIYFNFSNSEVEIDNQLDLSHFPKNGNVYISSTVKKETFRKIVDSLEKENGQSYDEVEEREGSLCFAGVGIVTLLKGGNVLKPCYIT